MDINQKIIALEKELAQLKELCKSEEQKKEWPQYGDDVFLLYADGDISKVVFDREFIHHKYILNSGSGFPTREAAEMELLRRKCRKDAYLPKEGEIVWCYSTESKQAQSFTWRGWENHLECYFAGLTRRTKEECEKLGRDFGKAFELPKE